MFGQIDRFLKERELIHAAYTSNSRLKRGNSRIAKAKTSSQESENEEGREEKKTKGLNFGKNKKKWFGKLNFGGEKKPH